MKVLIRNVKVISSTSSFNDQIKDILIEDGMITQIDNSISSGPAEIIEIEGLHVSEGWMDCFANFCDPGSEYKETIQSGSLAAATGGYTAVMLIPNTDPIIDNKAQVEYIKQQNDPLVDIYPIGAVTKHCDGKELAEIYDMYNSGAIAFSDGQKPIQSAGILLKALQYLLPIEGTLIQLPDDQSIGRSGVMNEGTSSTLLGLPGKPAIAEELLLARDIALATYTGSRMHFTGVSTATSLQMILDAKASDIKVSCSIAPYHFLFCDEELLEYDTNFKVNPPLRSKKDMLALRQALVEGKFDFIASHHQPQNWDNKNCEFEYANYGMSTLETNFSAAMNSGVDIHTFVQMQTVHIRRVFGLPASTVEVGSVANLTLFDPYKEYVFDSAASHSKSKNNALLNNKLRGKPHGIINRNKVFLNSNYLIH